MMETRNLAIICTVIVLCVLVGSFAVASNHPDKTQISVLSNSSLYDGENVTVQITTENGTPVANKTVSMAFVDSSGGKNVETATVNEDGIAILTLDGVTAGNYTLKCSFGGSDEYRESNCTSHLEVMEEVKQEADSSGYASTGNSYVDEILNDPTCYVCHDPYSLCSKHGVPYYQCTQCDWFIQPF